MCVFVHACLRACVHVCVGACVCMYVHGIVCMGWVQGAHLFAALCCMGMLEAFFKV